MTTATLFPLEHLALTGMVEQLTELGYTDLRTNYPLRAFPDMQETAALVAFDGDEPVVLCYPVEAGQVGDPRLQEAAKFQASAIGPTQSAPFFWVSDGEAHYCYDIGRAAALHTPPAPARRFSTRPP